MWPFKKAKSPAFPFGDTPNTACIACTHVAREGAPVLYVSHDADDGMWQFLCGGESHTEADALTLALSHVAELDDSLSEVADMPSGVAGEREDVGKKWKFYNNT